MKTLLERTKPEHLDRMSKNLACNLSAVSTIRELTIGEYIELRRTFPEYADVFDQGDIYGFCESIFKSVYEN